MHLDEWEGDTCHGHDAIQLAWGWVLTVRDNFGRNSHTNLVGSFISWLDPEGIDYTFLYRPVNPSIYKFHYYLA